VSYATAETGIQSGAPVELYLFALGADRWAYCSGDISATYNGDVYAPAPIKRSAPAVQSGSTPAGATLTLTVPSDFVIARKFSSFVPAAPLALTIYRYHRSDPGAVITLWSGRVRGAAWAGSTATLQCDSIDAAFRRQALRRGVGLNCEHMLYDQGCKINPSAFREAGTVGSISGNTITAGVFGSHANGWWVSGYARVALQDYRMIIAHSGSTNHRAEPVRGPHAGHGYRGVRRLRSHLGHLRQQVRQSCKLRRFSVLACQKSIHRWADVKCG